MECKMVWLNKSSWRYTFSDFSLKTSQFTSGNVENQFVIEFGVDFTAYSNKLSVGKTFILLSNQWISFLYFIKFTISLVSTLVTHSLVCFTELAMDCSRSSLISSPLVTLSLFNCLSNLTGSCCCSLLASGCIDEFAAKCLTFSSRLSMRADFMPL